MHARSCTCACADMHVEFETGLSGVKVQVNQLKNTNLKLWWKVTEAQSPVCAIADSLALYRNNIYGYIGQA